MQRRRSIACLRFLLLALAALLLALGSLGCKKKAEPATPAGQEATPKAPKGEAPRGTSGETFDPALLTERSVSWGFTVELPPKTAPPVRVALTGKPLMALVLRVGVECADQATFEELTKRGESLVRVLTECGQKRSADAARTAEGRAALREEIATALQKEMEHKGIKQVHLLEYRLEVTR